MGKAQEVGCAHPPDGAFPLRALLFRLLRGGTDVSCALECSAFFGLLQ